MDNRSNTRNNANNNIPRIEKHSNNSTNNIRNIQSSEKWTNRKNNKISKLLDKLEEEEITMIIAIILLALAIGFFGGSKITENSIMKAIEKGELYTIKKTIEQEQYDSRIPLINISFSRYTKSEDFDLQTTSEAITNNKKTISFSRSMVGQSSYTTYTGVRFPGEA